MLLCPSVCHGLSCLDLLAYTYIHTYYTRRGRRGFGLALYCYSDYNREEEKEEEEEKHEVMQKVEENRNRVKEEKKGICDIRAAV